MNLGKKSKKRESSGAFVLIRIFRKPYSVQCPHYYGIAGLALAIEEYQHGGDDTMLNKIKLYCVPISQFIDVFVDDRN